MRLHLNFSTSAAGCVGIELLDESGMPVPGFARDDMDEMFGDSLDHEVVWRNGSDLASLAGRPLRIRFTLSDADVYAFQVR